MFGTSALEAPNEVKLYFVPCYRQLFVLVFTPMGISEIFVVFGFNKEEY